MKIIRKLFRSRIPFDRFCVNNDLTVVVTEFGSGFSASFDGFWELRERVSALTPVGSAWGDTEDEAINKLARKVSGRDLLFDRDGIRREVQVPLIEELGSYGQYNSPWP